MNRSFLQRTPEPVVTRADYLNKLSQCLHRQLPADIAEEILMETSSHLEERANAFPDATVASGGSANFGSAALFARQMAVGAAETSFSRLAHRTGTVLLGGIFAALTVATLGSMAVMEGILWPMMNAMPLLIGSIAALAFLSRRSQRRCILAGGIILTIASLLTVAVYRTRLPDSTQQVDLRTLSSTRNMKRRDLADTRRDIALLQSGLSFYGSGENRTIPPSLKYQGGYIVPVRPTAAMNGWEDAFRPYVEERSGAMRFLPQLYATVATVAEAESRWSQLGHLRLRLRQRVLPQAIQDVQMYDSVPERISYFDPAVLNWDDLWTIPFAAAILVGDGLFAWAGRQLFWYRRASDRRKARMG